MRCLARVSSTKDSPGHPGGEGDGPYSPPSEEAEEEVLTSRPYYDNSLFAVTEDQENAVLENQEDEAEVLWTTTSPFPGPCSSLAESKRHMTSSLFGHGT